MRKCYAILISTLLVLSIFSVATPFVASTITNRPDVYYEGSYSDPLYVPAGANVSIWCGNMTITGGQVWLWLSKTGSADANLNAGDRWFAGPFYVGDIIAPAETPVTFTPSGVGYNIPAPFNNEGRNYTYTIGYGWINGTLPFMVQGSDVIYWLKITDVNPVTTPSIPSSDVGVSTNRLRFTENFFMTPNSGAPSTPITVSGYALPSTMTYNITQDGTTTKNNVSVVTNNESGWLWTGFSQTFPAIDLKNKLLCDEMYMPPVSESIEVAVIDNTSTTLFTDYFEEYFREVTLDDTSTYHGCIYHCGTEGAIVLNTGDKYNLTLWWFPYQGTANVYLNSSLVASLIPLNNSGAVGPYLLTIPQGLVTGNYYFRVVDSNGVEFNFTVCVVQVPAINFNPLSGKCGDVVTLEFTNMADFVGEVITVLFDYTPYDSEGLPGIYYFTGGYIAVDNFTVPSAVFTRNITIPNSAGGPRHVFLGDINGTALVFGPYDYNICTYFLVMPKVWVVPNTLDNTGSTFWVMGCGFLVSDEGVEGSEPWDNWHFYEAEYELWDPYMGSNVKYWVAVDNQFIAVGGGNGQVSANYTGNIAVQLVDAGFRPGKHTVSFYIKDRCDIEEYSGSWWKDYWNANTEMGVVAGDYAIYAYGTFTVTTAGDMVINDITAFITNSTSAVLVAIENDIATIRTELGIIKTNVATLDAKVVSLQGNVATVDTKVGTLQGTVTSLTNDMATVKTQVGTINAKVATFLPVDMMPVWIAVIFAIIAAIAAIYGVLVIRSKIAQ